MPVSRSRPKDSPALIAFGGQMRRMREAKNTTQQSLADHLNISKAQVSRIENGTRRANQPLVELIDRRLDADGALIKLWGDLNRNGHPVPVWFDWPRIEADAALLVCWEHSVIPGLAQTPAYAAAILHGNQEAVDARIARQSILTRSEGAPPPNVELLVDEQALYRPVGTAETMKEQLEHLAEISTRPNVTVQVVLTSGEHDGNTGAFVVATMDDRSEVAYVETAIRAITTDDPADLSVLARNLFALRSRTVTEDMSRELIRKVVRDKWT